MILIVKTKPICEHGVKTLDLVIEIDTDGYLILRCSECGMEKRQPTNKVPYMIVEDTGE